MDKMDEPDDTLVAALHSRDPRLQLTAFLQVLRVAVCCGVLQGVAVCCSVLQ